MYMLTYVCKYCTYAGDVHVVRFTAWRDIVMDKIAIVTMVTHVDALDIDDTV